MQVTERYLREHPKHIFVFGDNLKRVGKGGAASLRDEPNTYGFITKKAPCRYDNCYYKPAEYGPVFERELKKLIMKIEKNSDNTYLISKIGAGLANKFYIFDKIISVRLKPTLSKYDNVKFLW